MRVYGLSNNRNVFLDYPNHRKVVMNNISNRKLCIYNMYMYITPLRFRTMCLYK